MVYWKMSSKKNPSRRRFLKMSGLALTVGTTASAPVAADTVTTSADDDSIEAQDIGVGDTVRVPNDRKGRIFNRTTFTSKEIDAVPASAGGTVQNIGYSDYYEWYDVDWGLINVKEGWIPETDVYLF
jgi:secreted PhoX family phosphatase